MTTETVEEVDLTDLELLDDSHTHALCLPCNGLTKSPPLGTPFIAVCGRRAVHLTGWDGVTIPANGCPECVVIYLRRYHACKQVT